MAATNQSSILFLLFSLVKLSFIINSCNAANCLGPGAIAVYWGGSSSSEEGTLLETCMSGLYDIVIIKGIDVYDNGNIPVLDLNDHCGTMKYPCTELQPEIEYCQRNNIKVLLSIRNVFYGGAYYEDFENELAGYLLKNYFSGQFGPLGPVALDGIDISYCQDTPSMRFDKFVVAVNQSTTARKIYTSVTVQCLTADLFGGSAIRTGLVDNVWIEIFAGYNCGIGYNANITGILDTWKTWTSSAPNTFFFLDVTAKPNVSNNIYISPDTLKFEVLPTAKETSNYGGVMIRNRYEDKNYTYAGQTKNSVRKTCQCVCENETASTSFYGLRPGSLLNA